MSELTPFEQSLVIHDLVMTECIMHQQTVVTGLYEIVIDGAVLMKKKHCLIMSCSVLRIGGINLLHTVI